MHAQKHKLIKIILALQISIYAIGVVAFLLGRLDGMHYVFEGGQVVESDSDVLKILGTIGRYANIVFVVVLIFGWIAVLPLSIAGIVLSFFSKSWKGPHIFAGCKNEEQKEKATAGKSYLPKQSLAFCRGLPLEKTAKKMVGVRGFEPPASASRTQRSSQTEPHARAQPAASRSASDGTPPKSECLAERICSGLHI